MERSEMFFVRNAVEVFVRTGRNRSPVCDDWSFSFTKECSERTPVGTQCWRGWRHGRQKIVFVRACRQQRHRAKPVTIRFFIFFCFLRIKGLWEIDIPYSLIPWMKTKTFKTPPMMPESVALSYWAFTINAKRLSWKDWYQGTSIN